VQISYGIPLNQNITSFASNPSFVFTGLKVDGSFIKGIVRSSNNGNSWSQTGLTTYDIYSIAVSSNNVFAGTEDNGVYRSTDNGNSFSQVSNFGTYSGEVALLISGNYIFAGMWYFAGGAVYLSTNNGTNWTLASQFNSPVKCLAVNGSYLFAGTMTGGVYLSTNNGTTFAQTALNNQEVRCLAVNGSNVFAGTNPNGVFVSANNGSTWSQTSLNNGRINSLILSAANIFAGTNEGNIYQSSNNGVSWVLRNEGLPTTYIGIGALLISDNYIFAGTQQYSVWRRALPELIGIQNISTEVPASFYLYQNYPNPFNPSTKIRFLIPNLSDVKLTVYDAIGIQSAILVDQELKPGSYEVQWDASNYTSGVYYYKLTGNDYTNTKKLVLIK